MNTPTTPRDRRQRPPYAVAEWDGPVPGDLVSRKQAAELAGVTVRQVTRWVTLRYITKFQDARGRVAFSAAQMIAMNRYDPPDAAG